MATVWQYITELDTHLPYDPVFPLLGFHLIEIKHYVHTKTCIWIMFTGTLFLMARNWKQIKYLLLGKWINNGMEKWNTIQQIDKNEILTQSQHG